MAYKPSEQTINKRQHCKPPSITVTQAESDGDPSYSPSTAKEDEPWARPAGHMHASEQWGAAAAALGPRLVGWTDALGQAHTLLKAWKMLHLEKRQIWSHPVSQARAVQD